MASWRRMAVSGLTAAASLVVVALAPVQSAGAAVVPVIDHRQYGCTPDAATVEPGGALNQVVHDSADIAATPWRDFISDVGAVSVLSSTAYSYTGEHIFRTIVVRDGYLRLQTTRHPNGNPAARTHSSKVLGHGWGSVTKIVDASDRLEATKRGYLYALAPKNGTLARYRVTESTFGSPLVVSAGSRTGYGAFRSLALAYRYRVGTSSAVDVLVGTTSAGRLALIRIPVTSTFAPSVSTMRASTWTFDDLIVSGCNSEDRFALVAVRKSTQRAYLYRIDSFAGTSSVIRSYGAVRGSWASTRSSGFWFHDSYPSRWQLR